MAISVPEQGRLRHPISYFRTELYATPAYRSDTPWCIRAASDLFVAGDVDLTNCIAFTMLLSRKNFYGSLILVGCAAINALPDGMHVGGSLLLHGCTGLTSLPMGLSVDETLCFEDLLIGYDRVIVTQTRLPETIRTNVIGRRLGDVIGHWALSYRGIADRFIESVETDIDNDLVFHLENAE